MWPRRSGVLMSSPGIVDELTSHKVLFSCEGTCEEVVLKRLLEADRLVVSMDDVVWDSERGTPYTRLRTARDIEQSFLGVEYPGGPLLVARIVDVNPGAFSVSGPRKNDVLLRDFVTRPEIEVLALAREGKYDAWRNYRKKGRQLKPSEYCSGVLGMKHVKQRTFLLDYWDDADKVVDAIVKYRGKLGKGKGDELGLFDLLK